MSTELATSPQYMTLAKMLTSRADGIKSLVPKHLDADRLMKIAVGELRRVPKLQECTAESVLNAVIEAASLGVEIGMLNQGWLIPRYNGKAQKMEASFELGYGGLITVGKDNGDLDAVTLEIVRANDRFKRNQDGLEHEWNPWASDEARGPMVGVYAILTLTSGTKQYETMSKEQVDGIMARSQSANSGFSPWKTDYEEMAKKTVLKRAMKKVKLSRKAMEAIEKDNRAFDMIDAQVVDTVPKKLGTEALKEKLKAREEEPEPIPSDDNSFPNLDADGKEIKF